MKVQKKLFTKNKTKSFGVEKNLSLRIQGTSGDPWRRPQGTDALLNHHLKLPS